MNARNQRLLGLLLLIPVTVLVAWFLATHERVPRDIYKPFQGEARYNTLFALERALVAHGMRADSRATLGSVAQLGDADLLVLGTDVRTLGETQVDELLAWMKRGGRLLFALPRGSEGRGGPLLDRLHLATVEHFDCLHWAPSPAVAVATSTDDSDDDEEYDDEPLWCTSTRFTTDDGKEDSFAWLWGNADTGWLFGRHARGRGSWTVAAELDFLGNAALEQPHNTALAWQLLAPLAPNGIVHLVYSADVPPFHVLLARAGWPILLPVLLALIAWLWSRGQRFGPLLPLPPPHRRALLEHVRAAGAFAWRRARGVALHDALARRVLGAAQRRRPELLALEGDALARTLAEDAGVTPEAARHALAPASLAQPQEFLSAIRTLTEIDARHDR